MATTLLKYNTEIRTFAFNYEEMPEIVAGQTLASATITATPAGLTIGTPSISGGKVFFVVTGGTAGVTYDIQCLATTSSGSKLLGCGLLAVESC